MEKKSVISRVLQSVARFSAGKPWLVISIVLAITIVAGILASSLKLKLTWIDMVPQDDPSVVEFKKIAENYGASSSIILAIENEDPQKLKIIVKEVAETLRTITNFFSRVDYQYDRDFIKNNALMLQRAKDLNRSKNVLANLDLTPFLSNINDNFENTYIGGEESLEDNEIALISGINSYVQVLEGLREGVNSDDPNQSGIIYAERNFDDSLYSFSSDKKMVLLSILPTMKIDDMEESAKMVPVLRAEIDKFKDTYPDSRFRLTGMHIICNDEMKAVGGDSMGLTIVSFIIILIAFVVVFRMWSSPLLAMIALVFGIIWDLGLTYLVIGQLNMFTAVGSLIILGLGVDYFIHIVSGYSEGKAKGLSSVDASAYSMEKVGEGVFIGALTTAIAFYVLAFSKMDFFKEFAFVVGTGIIATMLASFIVLPALLSIFHPQEKREFSKGIKILLIILAIITVIPAVLIAIEWLSKKIFGSVVKARSPVFEKWGGIISRRPGAIIIITLAILAVLAIFIPRNWFDGNMLNMEVKGLESVELQRDIIKRYGLSDGAMVFTTDSIAESQLFYNTLSTNSLVGRMDSIAAFLPSAEKQEERMPFLLEINNNMRKYTPSNIVDKEELVWEIDRFIMNLQELLQMSIIGGQKIVEKRIDEILSNEILTAVLEDVQNAETKKLIAFQSGFGNEMKDNILSMSTPAYITLSDIPDSIVDRYLSDNGESYLTSVYSKTDSWDIMNSPFIRMIEKYVPQATGTIRLYQVMLDETIESGKFVIILSFVVIFILLLINFRNIKAALIAVSPLILGAVFMLGVLGIPPLAFTFVMIMMLPLIIGIGIDDGVHILHRYLLEGDDFPLILSTTGKALFFTTFSTVVVFGSFAFAKYQGFVGMGIMLAIGLGAVYLVTITFVPATLRLLDKKFKINIEPWGSKRKKT